MIFVIQNKVMEKGISSTSDGFVANIFNSLKLQGLFAYTPYSAWKESCCGLLTAPDQLALASFLVLPFYRKSCSS